MKKTMAMALSALTALGTAAHAGTYTWTGAANDGLWFTAGNWNLDGAAAATSPGSGPSDDVVYVDENPQNAERSERCRLLKFGREIMSYESFTTERPLFATVSSVQPDACFRFLRICRSALNSVRAIVRLSE